MKIPRPLKIFFFTLALLSACWSAASAQTPPDIPMGDPRPAPGPSRGGSSTVKTGPAEVPRAAGVFKSEAGGFSVRFPFEPRVEDVPFRNGTISFTRHVFTSVMPGGMFFEVEYADMQPGYGVSDLSLEGGASGVTHALEARGAVSLTRETIKRGSCEGREVTLSLPNPSGRKPGFAQARIFYSGYRLFSVLFVAERDAPSARKVGLEFMESFEVTGGCLAASAPSLPKAKTTGFIEGTRDPVTGWRRIEVEEFGLGMLMPGATEHDSDRAQAEPFPLMHHTYIYRGEEAVYSAEVMGDYPPEFGSMPGSHDSLLDTTSYALKKNLGRVGFVFTPERESKLGALKGREYEMSNEKTGAHGRVQIFATANRVYIFMAFMRGKTGDPSNLERFFSSVKLSAK